MGGRALEAFEVAGGSVCGREHTRLGRGSQDAMCWKRSERCIVAVVSDGCGSGRHSEVGAKLGSRLLTEILSRRAGQGERLSGAGLWRGAEAELLILLGGLVEAMGGDRASVVADYFLFTLVGVVATSTATAIFAVGDGLYALNGEVSILGPFENNSPPYLGYGLLQERGCEPARLQPSVLMATSTVDSLLLATDGVLDLVAADGADRLGRTSSLDEFWTRDSFFANSDGLRRRLAVLNRDAIDVDWDRQRLNRSCGLFADDTTIVAIRRRDAGGGA